MFFFQDFCHHMFWEWSDKCINKSHFTAIEHFLWSDLILCVKAVLFPKYLERENTKVKLNYKLVLVECKY